MPPDRPQALRPLTQFRLVVRDAHVDDIIVLPPPLADAGLPGDRLDDELDSLEAPGRGSVVDVALSVAVQR
jgi:hypothetical protein